MGNVRAVECLGEMALWICRILHRGIARCKNSDISAPSILNKVLIQVQHYFCFAAQRRLWHCICQFYLDHINGPGSGTTGFDTTSRNRMSGGPERGDPCCIDGC
jgi:hypothetical protein